VNACASSSKHVCRRQRGEIVIGRLGRVIGGPGLLNLEPRWQLNSMTNVGIHTTTFEYDSMGRRIKRTLPGGQVETYQYDLAGNLVSKTDFNGYTTTYQYDAMNRLMAKIPDPRRCEPAVTFAYNELGLRTNMLDASGTTEYRYDVRGRLIQKIKTWAAVGLTVALNYTHDACGNLTGIQSSSPNGVSLAYSYDPLNRLESVNDAHTGTTIYSYDSVGNMAGYVYPNGVGTVFEYDSLNRLTNMVSRRGSELRAWYRYTVLPSGHRRTASENVATAGGVQTINRLYSYDATYRLLNESLAVTGPVGLPASANVGYTLDAVGNRLSRTSTLPGVESVSYGYDANDRLISDLYDENGNTLLGLQSEREQLTCGYDFEDRLITATTADGKTITIVYDGDGNRVAKAVTGAGGSVTTLYVVDEQNPTGYAQVLEEYISGNSGVPILRIVYSYGNDLISQSQLLDDGQGGFVWVTSFYGYDGHGSVRYLTDSNGNVTDTFDYDAFGNLIAAYRRYTEQLPLLWRTV
jgi:YD repeat-containing protein